MALRDHKDIANVAAEGLHISVNLFCVLHLYTVRFALLLICGLSEYNLILWKRWLNVIRKACGTRKFA